MKPGDILKFWFEETAPKFHFNATPAFDADIRRKFEPFAIEQAAKAQRGEHLWEKTPEGSLALIVMLDQFPRNMYRGTPAAFAWDHLALAISNRAIDKGFDLKIPLNRRSFMYMPFMHSEVLTDQKRCVDLVDQRLDDDNTLFHAKAHQKVIGRFGRFPHRNEILGRSFTAEEVQYIKDGGYSP